METKNIYTAFLEMQKELPAIEKDAQVSFNKVKFKYAKLETIHKIVKPILHSHGFHLRYEMTTTAVNIVIARGEDHITSSIKFEPVSDPKQTGSLITYYKRYLITALLALDTEDDLDVEPFKEQKKAIMTDSVFEKVQDRISNGEKDVLAKCLLHFDLTQDQHNKILNLDLDING